MSKSTEASGDLSAVLYLRSPRGISPRKLLALIEDLREALAVLGGGAVEIRVEKPRDEDL